MVGLKGQPDRKACWVRLSHSIWLQLGPNPLSNHFQVMYTPSQWPNWKTGLCLHPLCQRVHLGDRSHCSCTGSWALGSVAQPVLPFPPLRTASGVSWPHDESWGSISLGRGNLMRPRLMGLIITLVFITRTARAPAVVKASLYQHVCQEPDTGASITPVKKAPGLVSSALGLQQMQPTGQVWDWILLPLKQVSPEPHGTFPHTGTQNQLAPWLPAVLTFSPLMKQRRLEGGSELEPWLVALSSMFCSDH